MTFKEKLQKEHPEYVDKQYCAGCKGCPHNYGYEEKESASTFCKRTNCTECWNREMPIAKTYEQGLADAWDLARKIFGSVDKGGYSDEQLEEAFGCSYLTMTQILYDLTPQEALAKIEAYKKSQQIQVGDVVEVKSIAGGEYIGVVTQITANQNVACIVYSDGSTEMTTANNMTKTGRHIDIQQIFDGIGAN